MIMAEPIAVIGFAFEFPQGATSSDSFWQILCEGRSTSTNIPSSRFKVDAFYHPDATRTSTFPVRGGHFIERDLGDFDAPFFSITPGEVACMDPQHRGMLETAYHALEDAGISISDCSGSETSVYTGCFTNDYLSVLQQDYELKQTHAAMGAAASMLANRVSWFFNLKGTSLNLDSACSSSLVALHLACRDLQLGTASMALVGGANLVYHPNFMKMMSAFDFLSPDGRCWSFDERANGYARGEGLVMVVLKRLSDALHDGDTIRAVIRSTGSNQDGRTPGITQPSIESQVRLIHRTYREADLDMAPTRFFEAHGTGTVAGDHAEANAIGQAFRACRTVDDPLYIGAVKANIGHLEGASGLAGFVKAILVLENALIPPIAGLEELNSRIDADKLGLQFPKQPIPWPTAGLRRACVNSFGFGGTNATVILDDAYHYLELNSLQGCHRTRRLPPPCYEPSSLSNGSDISEPCSHTRSAPQTPTLFVWSGADKQAAQTLTIAYHDFIRRARSDLPSIAYSMVQRRTPLQWRAFVVADTNQDSLLHAPQSPSPTRVQDNPRLAYIFTGQGAQCLGMGRELFSFAAFRESIELCDQCLQQLECSWSVQQVLEGYADEISVEDPEFGQPLTTCLQIALTDLLKSLGIAPVVVLGHSSGEIAAAYAVGGLSRFSAVVVAYYRGLLSSQLARQASGLSMMAVGLSRVNVQSYLDRLGKLYGSPRVSIGCVNSPQNITLTGAVDQLDVLQEWFARDLITARRLRIPLAYHSEAMAAVVRDYRSLMMGKLETGAKDDSICMISSVTSDIVQPRALNSPEYWINNLISVVDFEGALAKLIAHSNKQPRKRLGGDAPSDLRTSHLLEIGPHSALQGPVREALQASSKARKPAYIPLLIRGRNSRACLMEAAGWLYCAGFPVDILAVNGIYRGTPPPMPCGMPQYPFTHTRSHWAEGRLSENFRMKSKARHDLVGTRSVDWNPQLAQWRNILRLREVPWLQDHTIDGQIVVPAAGMVVMAVEALRELLGAEVQLAGIHLKNVGFLHPMRYTHDTEELETQLTLSADGQPRVGDSVWFHFRLFAIDGGSYTECCNGDIRGVVVPDNSPSYMLDGEPLQAWVSNATAACTQPSNAYSFLARGAVKYGPCFRGVESLRVSTSGEAICDVNMDTWRPHTSQEQPPEYLVHPCTLDALIQLVVPSLTGGQGALPTTVPARASRIWIDCSASLELKKGKIIALARSVRVNRGTTSDIVGMTRGTARPVLRIDNLETRFIDTVSADHTETGPRVLCTKLVWRPDISMMDEGQVLDAVTRDRPRAPEGAISQFQALTLAILCFIQEALFYLDTLESLSVPVYLHAYVDWMRHQQQTLHPYVSATAVKDLLANSEAREHLIATTEISGMEGYFYMQVGRQLIPILTGAVDPLDLMFSDGLADRYYEEVLSTPHHAYPAMAYLQQLCFKNPALNILEVGAGTGGQTLRLLEAITSDGVPKCTRYDYTDISPAFFARAREKFRGYADIVHFRTLNISQDPISQSFKPADYDLVIASHVLHATPKLDESLQNIRKLLKPGGKLLLVETTRPDCLYVGFALGLLKGWWEPLGHESRSRLSPCLETTQWDRVLKLNGFSGVDIDLPGQEHMEYRYSSIIISTAVASGTSTASNGQVLLVTSPDNNYQAEVAALIGKDLPSSVCTLEELAGITLSPSTSVVFLLELRAFVLDGMSAETYERLHSILIRAKNVLWVGQPITAEDLPQHHLAEGLGRSLASEDSTLKFVTLVLDHAEPDQRAAHLVLKVIKHMEASSIEAMEANWRSNSGILHIPRLSDSSEINGTVSLMLRPCRQEHCTLTTDTKVRLGLGSSESLDSLRYIEDILDPSPLQEDEVVVQVKAFGLTFRDYLIYSGQIDQLDLGLECSGVITETGSRSGYLPGDRVCLIGMRLAQSHVRAHVSNVVPIPAGMDTTEAASLPCSLWIAYYAIHYLARLQPDESVLIPQASSSVGQMLVQLATKRGAQVLAMASTDAKKAFISDSLHVPEDNVLVLSPGSSVDGFVHRLTDGKGIDAVIGPLSGHCELDLDLSSCLAPCGRIIDTNLTRRKWHQLTLHANSISYTAVNMVDIMKAKPTLTRQTLYDAMQVYREEQLCPPQPIKVFSAGDVEAAFREFQGADTFGKRVVEFADGMPIQMDCATKPLNSFSPTASYIIAGGLGGLGRSFARWMVDRGARHLILLSRSGASISAARDLVRELELRGVTVATPKVDISNLSSLGEVLAQLAETMPPVRGCIQATMVLRDNLFENMSYDDWVVSTSCKVAGSWNLHSSLPADLDFFILMASTNGIFGNRGQANYAAGNTFMDALARYRLARGQKAVSIDLGMMIDEGVVAANQSLLASLRRLGHLMELRQEELLALLDYYCNPDLPLLPPDNAQVIVGIQLPSEMIAKGFDLHHSIKRPIFSHLFQMAPRHLSASASAPLSDPHAIDRPATLKAAPNQEEATSLVTEWACAKVSHVLGLSVSDIDPAKPIHVYGIDSLVAVDLKNWFEREIGARLSVFDLMGNVPLQTLAELAAEASRFRC